MSQNAALVSASADAAPTASAQRHRVVIGSIGTATPDKAASVALGLSVPVPRILETFYRAPTILVDDLAPEIAESMAALLRDLGCDAYSEACSAPTPPPATLVDVAVHVSDPDAYGGIVSALAAFLGASEDDAARLLMTPPGIVLGAVSPATVEALRDRLGDGASILASRPEDARYDVFLGDCDHSVAQRVRGDLRRQGFELLGDSGCVLTGLEKATADRLWKAHHRIAAFRVINRDFLRFDVVMIGTASGIAPDDRMLARLSHITGIPDDIAPQLFDHCPITVMEAVPAGALDATIQELGDAGFLLRADLTTFLHLQPEILAAPDPRGVAEVLTRLGLHQAGRPLPGTPHRLAVRLPDLQARLLRAALEAQGAKVALHDPAEDAP